jgi:hypothetical protein
MAATGCTRLAAAALLALLAGQAAQARAPQPATETAARPASALSAQARAARPRRAPTRIEVRPLYGPNPLHRECVPVFTERWIPQWGGRVLYASQRCWWSRQ